MLAAMAASALRLSRELPTVFAFAPPDVTPPELRAQAAQVEALLPPDAPALFVTADTDTWDCGVWQRLMYPRLVFCLLTTGRDYHPLAAELRQRFAVRHAIAEGEPPPGVTFRHRRAVGALPFRAPISVGELAP